MLYILVNKLLILKYGPLLSWTPCICTEWRWRYLLENLQLEDAEGDGK